MRLEPEEINKLWREWAESDSKQIYDFIKSVADAQLEAVERHMKSEEVREKIAEYIYESSNPRICITYGELKTRYSKSAEALKYKASQIIDRILEGMKDE